MSIDSELSPPRMHWRQRLRPHGSSRLRRFSLRGLLLLTTLCCVLLGVWSVAVEPYRRQSLAIATVADLQGRYATEAATGSPLSRWLVTTMLGDDKFVRLTAIDLQRTAANDETLAQLRGLRELTTLNLDRTDVTDDGLRVLASLPKLQSLSLCYTGITDAGLSILTTLPEDMREVALTGTRVTDASVPHFAGRSIMDLYLRWTDVTPEGARRIKDVLRRGAVHYAGDDLSSLAD
jgi:hypothetical protein